MSERGELWLVDEQAHKIEKINLSIDFILGHQFLKGASG